MKSPASLATCCGIVMRNDWRAFRATVYLLTFAWLVLLVLIKRNLSLDFARSSAAGLLLIAPFVYARACCHRRSDLKPLLAFPMTPAKAVLAKYASALSMTAFTINLPGLLLGDLRLLLYANAAGLFITTAFMAPAIISDSPWAHLISLWIAMILARPALQAGSLNWLAAHATGIAAAAVLSIPIIIFVCIQHVSWKTRTTKRECR
jgi:hypothetical protein